MKKSEIKRLKEQINHNEMIIDKIESKHKVGVNPTFSQHELKIYNHAQGIINEDSMKLP